MVPDDLPAGRIPRGPTDGLASPITWPREPRVLIIDNDVTNVRVLERILRRFGLSAITSTTDPFSAVPLFCSEEPDLVLLDLHMPHLDGFAVLDALLPLIPPHDYLPILVLTGDDHSTTRERALRKGATDFLGKPFDLPTVILRVRNLLQTRLLHLTLKELRSRT